MIRRRKLAVEPEVEPEVEVEPETGSERKAPIIRPDISNYVVERTASGGKAHNNGDEVAQALSGCTTDEVAEVLVAIDPELGTARDIIGRYSHLNRGQQRMAIGNRIRGVVKKLNLSTEEGTAGSIRLKEVSGDIRKSVDARLAEFEQAREEKNANAKEQALLDE
jgi:hypothetical protein